MSDNELDHDLSAWEAPPAPAGIADAVLARMDGTGVVPAVPEGPRSSGRRTMLIAGVAAACLAASAGTYMLIRSSRPAGPASGAVVASAARTLSLGGATAELDAGADVRWQRHGDVLNVEQRAGNASWRVDKDLRLLIDAGVTVASVDASGASLRVEVQMNSMDAKILGGSAVTAAAVSLVAVTVYSGAVKVHDGGQTVIVKPGTTYSVTPVTTPPPTPDLVGAAPITFDASRPTLADVLIPAGEAATVHVPSLPAMVEIDAGGLCSAGVEYYADGVRKAGAMLILDAGMHGYGVRCVGDSVNAAAGSLVVVVDDAHNPIITSASGPLALIATPGAGAVWSDPLEIVGTTQINARASIGGIALPVLVDGRFSTHVPRPSSNIIALRIERQTHDVDYFIVRGSDATVDTSCDEVSCVLNNYEGECCAKFKVSTPASLDRATIASVMSALKPQLQACAQQEPGQGGTLTLQVEVAPDGNVIRADATKSYSDDVSACVTNIVHHATFPATKKGGTFSYPYIFKTTLTVGAGSSSTVASAPTGLTRTDISQAIAGVKSRIQGCASKSSKSGTVKVKVIVRPDGKVGSLATMETFDNAVSGCVLDIIKTVQFPPTDDGGSFSYPFVFGVTGSGSSSTPVASASCDEVSCVLGTGDPVCCAKYKKSNATPLPACDAEALKEAGMEAINRGEHALALAKFEAALRCKPDPFVLQLAFMEACSAKNVDKARIYYPKLTTTQQTKFLQICTRNGIDPVPPKSAAACDANALKEDGMAAVNLGQHAEALAKFEASLACKPDAYVISLAYMSSCSSKNAAKARLYFAQLTSAQQAKFDAMCTRNGIDPRATATAVPPKMACDATALKDDGIEKASLGEHTEAAASLESSYRCKADPTLPQMIVREACAAQNAPLARTWYGRLPTSEQKLVNTFCTGVGIKLLDPGDTPSGMGYLVVLSTPAARISIDGKDTGLTTPISGKTLKLKAGDHRVTYLVPSGDRFTYKVTVPAGGAVTLSKNLE